MSYYLVWLLVVLFKSNSGLSLDGFPSVQDGVITYDTESMISSEAGKGIPSNVEEGKTTTIDVYAHDSTYRKQENGEPSIVICNESDESARENCHHIFPQETIEARSSSSARLNNAHGLRQPNQHQPYPPFVNNGNAVHIQGNFQGSPPTGGQINHQNPPLNNQQNTNIADGNGFAPQQSPLVSFNLHSEPHFYPNIPVTNTQQTKEPKTQRTQAPVDSSSAILRINSKFRVNTTDISDVLQAIQPQNPIINSHNDIQTHKPQIFASPEQTTSTPYSLPSTQNTPITPNEDTQTTPLPLESATNPNLEWITQKTPLTESQSLAILRGQISSPHNLGPYTHTVPQGATQNTINIQVPTGSSVSATHNQADIADILTNLQILTVLMNQDGKNKSVFNSVLRTPSNSPTLNNNDENIEIGLSQNIPEHRQLQKIIGMHPIQTQARNKAQLITSLPHYANQFAFTANPTSMTQRSPQGVGKKNKRPVNPNNSQNHHGDNNARIDYASLSSFLQGEDQSNPYNQIIRQLALGQTSQESQDNSAGDDIKQVFASPSIASTPQTSRPLNLPQDMSPPITLNPQGNRPLNSSKPDTGSPQQNVENNRTVEAEPVASQNTSIPISQLTLKQLQQLEMFNTLLHTFNNRHQNQQIIISPIDQVDANMPKPQDFILASLLQEAVKKPEITPSVIQPNGPYIPAYHDGNVGNSFFPQPPAPPPTTDGALLTSLRPSAAPFPVRAASEGGEGGPMEQCLKSKVCALFIACVVAAGTTTALAIPVLTPLIGASFFGRRRRREIRYFVIKPEDTVEFIDKYFEFANGTDIPDLNEDTKCIFKTIMDPNADSSRTTIASLLNYIFANKDKHLKIYVQEVEKLSQKPIPSSFLQSLNNDDTTSQLELLKSTLNQTANNSVENVNTTNPSYQRKKDPNILNMEGMDDEKILYTVSGHEHFNPSLLMNNGELQNGNSDIFQNIRRQLLSVSGSFPNPHTQTPNTEFILNTHQYSENPQYGNFEVNQNSKHTSQHSKFSKHDSFENVHKFHPIPRPNLQVQSPPIPVNSDTPYPATASSLESTLISYLLPERNPSGVQSTHYKGAGLNTPHSAIPGIYYNAFPYNQAHSPTPYPQVLYQARNRYGIISPAPFDSNFQQQQYQEPKTEPIAGVLDFYHTLCHALGEPDIPHTSVIAFIAQRCLLFAHAGLIK